MKTPEYHTLTDQRWYAGFTTGIGLIISIVAAIGMWIWLQALAPALFVMGICMCMALFMGAILMRQNPVQLHFEKDTLYLRLSNGQEYTVYDVPARDFHCIQTSFERKHNVGRIKIKDTVFNFYGVQNFDETCRYIKDNFPSN